MLWKMLGIALLVLVLGFVFRLVAFGATSRKMSGPEWTGGALAACTKKPNCVLTTMQTSSSSACGLSASGPRPTS